jgi:hypothetical protein
LVEPVEPLEIDISAVEDVDRAGFGNELIQDADIVHLPICDAQEGRDASPQIEQRVELDRAALFLEQSPRKEVETQIDGRGIECIDRLLELHIE